MEQTLKNYSWIVDLGILALIAWLIAGLIGSWVAQRWPPPIRTAVLTAPMEVFAPPDLTSVKEAILRRNLFGLNLQDTPDSPIALPLEGQTAEKSALKYTLFGTLVTPNPKQSIATVLMGNETKRYHEGDLFEGKHAIQSISRGRVEFINQGSGRLEYIGFAERQKDVVPPPVRPSGISASAAKGIAQTSENEFVISLDEWNRTTANLNSILTQARAIPNTVEGKTNGFRVLAIKPGSIYEKLGIKNGDILTKVNGSEVNTIQKAMNLFESLRNDRNFQINIVRGGSEQTLKYEIK